MRCTTFGWCEMNRETGISNFSVEEKREREIENDPVEMLSVLTPLLTLPDCTLLMHCPFFRVSSWNWEKISVKLELFMLDMSISVVYFNVSDHSHVNI